MRCGLTPPSLVLGVNENPWGAITGLAGASVLIEFARAFPRTVHCTGSEILHCLTTAGDQGSASAFTPVYQRTGYPTKHPYEDACQRPQYMQDLDNHQIETDHLCNRNTSRSLALWNPVTPIPTNLDLPTPDQTLKKKK